VCVREESAPVPTIAGQGARSGGISIVVIFEVCFC
jgi:hypothetical protein